MCVCTIIIVAMPLLLYEVQFQFRYDALVSFPDPAPTRLISGILRELGGVVWGGEARARGRATILTCTPCCNSNTAKVLGLLDSRWLCKLLIRSRPPLSRYRPSYGPVDRLLELFTTFPVAGIIPAQQKAPSLVLCKYIVICYRLSSSSLVWYINNFH